MGSTIAMHMNTSTQRLARHQVQGELSPLPTVRNIIAVGSGKGGVGKSTTAVNLAAAAAARGLRTGLLDADIYGPSIPTMLGVSGRPDSPDGKHLTPMDAFGISLMSIGFLVESDSPMIWRGPMATSALTQFTQDTLWPDLDVLFVDLPPGTGDIQLSMAQKIPVAGAVIVTTPQEVATLDARKALRMFEKVEIPVLGLVENMALHVCSQCGHADPIFGEGGGSAMAQQYGVRFLGQLPLLTRVREQGDIGAPIVVADPTNEASKAFENVLDNVLDALSQRPTRRGLVDLNLA